MTELVTALHVLVTLLIVSALLFSVAVRRYQANKEPPSWRHGRTLIASGWFLFAMRAVYLLATQGKLNGPPLSLIALSLLAMGTIVICSSLLLAAQQGQQGQQVRT